MNPDTATLKALDAHYLFDGLEKLALIVLIIIVAKALLGKPGLFIKEIRKIAWICVIILAIAIAAQYAADLYNYVHATRPFYVQARHSTTGL